MTKAKEKEKALRRAVGYAKALITHLNVQRANQRAKAKQLQPTGWQKTQVGNRGVSHRSRSDSCLNSQWSQETCNKYNYHQKGPHCASQCPKGKSKGKGKAAPAYGLAEDASWESWSEPSESIRQLSGLSVVTRDMQQVQLPPKGVPLRNRFQDLESTEAEFGHADVPDGDVGIPRTPAPPAAYTLDGANLWQMARRNVKIGHRHRHKTGFCDCRPTHPPITRNTTPTQDSCVYAGPVKELNEKDNFDRDVAELHFEGASAALMGT